MTVLFRRRSALLFAALLVLAGCGEFRPVGSSYHYIHYKVQRSDTLFSIAFRFGYDYHEVASWNNIPPPYIIHAGDDLMILDTPPGDTAEEEQNAPNVAPVAGGQAPTKGAAAKADKGTPAKHWTQANTPAHPAAAIKWSWPTKGTVAARFSARQGRKGIDLSGNFGQPVKAAADGDVVYSGSGLIGYGNLVIIKHDEIFLSAYGHNRKLLVKEGDKVKAGQPIGEMGQHAKSGSILHFEIRRHGKPVDPLLYLPQTS